MEKVNIYIDLTNYCSVKYTTGIQRVVSEVVTSLVKESENLEIKVNLLRQKSENEFYIISYDEFKKREIKFERVITLDNLVDGSFFIELDSVWNIPFNREVIYKSNQRKSIKLVVLVYDIIPLNNYNFFIRQVFFNFLIYFNTVIKYANVILVSADKVKNDIQNALDKVGYQGDLEIKKLRFGYKFGDETTSSEKVGRKVKAIATKEKYLLMVGTMEPRKNHITILEAFEKELFEKGYSLVIVGKFGWNADVIQEKISNSVYLDKKLHRLTNINDATLNYLYSNAYVTVQASHDEGFGLPIIEALNNNSPIILSDIDVFREVTQNKGVYFNQNSSDDFLRVFNQEFSKDKRDEVLRQQKEIKLSEWSDTAHDLVDAIRNCKNSYVTVKRDLTADINEGVKQVAILTNRDEVVDTIEFIENLMLFVKEIVIATPEKMIPKIKERYTGNLKLVFVSDEALLNGAPLPKDHQERNLFLRKLLVQRDEIDTNFIMYDDDYRPLRMIDEDFFIENGKYNMFYFYDVEKWYPYGPAYSSFDHGAVRYREFAKKHGLTTLQFDSHMPQPMNKHIWKEIIENYPESNVTEWCLYFNYLNTYYSEFCTLNNYKTLGWPGRLTSWPTMVEVEDYAFENYYDTSYDEGAMFEGLDRKFSQNYLKQSFKKIEIMNRAKLPYIKNNFMQDIYSKLYKLDTRANAEFATNFNDGLVEFFGPKYITTCSATFFLESTRGNFKENRLPIKIQIKHLKILEEDKNIKVVQKLFDGNSNEVFNVEKTYELYKGLSEYAIHIYEPVKSGKYLCELTLTDIDNNVGAILEMDMIAL